MDVIGIRSRAQRLLRLTVLAVVLVAAALPFASSPAAARSLRVAVIVGPVGEKLTPQYIELAEMAADEAERGGATVMRAYSPKATPERVLRAVEGANIVIYFGHGTGFPNPYSETLNPEVVNGWGLQGPGARGTHEDDLGKGRLAYYGEAWLAANAHPAPGFVMIYSNACYAPGASEGRLPKPDEREALTHVANYSRAAFAMGASAYYAIDFYGGAARLVHALLDQAHRPFADVFRSEPEFSPEALSRHAHPQVPETQIWLHRSAYFDGDVDYWYAFAGNPRAHMADAGAGPLPAPAQPPTSSSLTGMASSYRYTHGFETTPTVALPVAIGGTSPGSTYRWVGVCADRCARLPVVDVCECYYGTDQQRIVNLSQAAWQLISDKPLAEGVIPIHLYLDGKIPAHAGRTPLTLAVDPKPPGMNVDTR
ncbi:MAG TPA: hypothetical protein VIH19_07700 [Candidatus Limnocylindria bacterium]